MEICKLLLAAAPGRRNKASPSESNGALVLAAEAGHVAVSQLLKDRGVLVDALQHGALMKAASNGHTEVCQLLLQNISIQGPPADDAIARTS